MRQDGTGRRKGRTVEEADVDAGVTDAGGQRPPNIEVRARSILEVSRERNGWSAYVLISRRDDQHDGNLFKR